MMLLIELRNVLQPEISYTAYNTICYFAIGPSYRRLENGQVRALMKQLRPSTDEFDNAENDDGNDEVDDEPLRKPTKASKSRKRRLVEPEVIDISD